MAARPYAQAKALSQEEGQLLMRALAIPPVPGFRGAGARVEHVLAPRDGALSEVLTEALGLPQGTAELLLRFGAVHTCPVPPPLPAVILAGMSPAEAARVQQARHEALRLAGNSPQARTPQRVARDAPVQRLSYIRVHLHPKRFPAAHAARWAQRVVACTPDYVVVSKPAGVPAAPTVDNLLECAPACTVQALGLAEPLRVTHRLDQCTEGLLVLGRSREFVAAFNALVQRSSGSGSEGPGSGAAGSDGDNAAERGGGRPLRPLRKFYRAVTAAPPPPGPLRHHLSVERRQRGLPSFTVAHDDQVAGSQTAELVVLQAAPVQLSPAAAARWGTGTAHECLLELLTGRTHQIRAQLSAAGHPLLGDSLYAPLACPQLRQRLFAGDPSLDAQPGGARLLVEPEGGIGLQASRLLVADACMGGSAAQPAEFEAGTPWWRARAED